MKVKKGVKYDSAKSKADAFFYKMIHYAGIIFLLLVMIYASYILLPDIFKFIKTKAIKFSGAFLFFHLKFLVAQIYKIAYNDKIFSLFN